MALDLGDEEFSIFGGNRGRLTEITNIHQDFQTNIEEVAKTADLVVSTEGRGIYGTIQEAVADAKAGDRILVEKGIYTVASTITLKSGITIEGTGLNSTIKLADGANTNIFRMFNHDDITIKGLRFNGNAGNNTSGTGILITNGSSRNKIQDCSFNDFDGWAVEITSTAENNQVKGCTITAQTGGGIHFESGTGNVGGNIISNNLFWEGGGNGIQFDQGADGNLVINNAFDDWTIGILVQAGSTNTQIMNNVCSNGTTGILLEDSADKTICMGNQCNNNGAYGIRSTAGPGSAPDRCIYVGNVILNNTTTNLSDSGTNSQTANNIIT